MFSRPTHINLNFDEFVERSTKDLLAVVLDVRTFGEFEEAHLPDAININIKSPDFAEEIDELNRQNHYYVYCSMGIRSVNACTLMRQMGFENLYNLKGGVKAYLK